MTILELDTPHPEAKTVELRQAWSTRILLTIASRHPILHTRRPKLWSCDVTPMPDTPHPKAKTVELQGCDSRVKKLLMVSMLWHPPEVSLAVTGCRRYCPQRCVCSNFPRKGHPEAAGSGRYDRCNKNLLGEYALTSPGGAPLRWLDADDTPVNDLYALTSP